MPPMTNEDESKRNEDEPNDIESADLDGNEGEYTLTIKLAGNFKAVLSQKANDGDRKLKNIIPKGKGKNWSIESSLEERLTRALKPLIEKLMRGR